MRTNRKTLAAGLGATGALGLGLYLAVPAFAADPSPSASPTAKPNEPGKERPFGWRHGPRGHGPRGPGGHGGHGGPGVHGEATVRHDGGFRVRTWQRGEITALTSGGLTVRGADGTSWTWKADGDTAVRKDREKTGLSGLARGDEVMVVGTRSGGTRTARLIRVR